MRTSESAVADLAIVYGNLKKANTEECKDEEEEHKKVTEEYKKVKQENRIQNNKIKKFLTNHNGFKGQKPIL